MYIIKLTDMLFFSICYNFIVTSFFSYFIPTAPGYHYPQGYPPAPNYVNYPPSSQQGGYPQQQQPPSGW